MWQPKLYLCWNIQVGQNNEYHAKYWAGCSFNHAKQKERETLENTNSVG